MWLPFAFSRFGPLDLSCECTQSRLLTFQQTPRDTDPFLNTCVQQRLEHITVSLHQHLQEGGREPWGRGEQRPPLQNTSDECGSAAHCYAGTQKAEAGDQEFRACLAASFW